MSAESFRRRALERHADGVDDHVHRSASASRISSSVIVIVFGTPSISADP